MPAGREARRRRERTDTCGHTDSRHFVSTCCRAQSAKGQGGAPERVRGGRRMGHRYTLASAVGWPRVLTGGLEQRCARVPTRSRGTQGTLHAAGKNGAAAGSGTLYLAGSLARGAPPPLLRLPPRTIGAVGPALALTQGPTAVSVRQSQSFEATKIAHRRFVILTSPHPLLSISAFPCALLRALVAKFCRAVGVVASADAPPCSAG